MEVRFGLMNVYPRVATQPKAAPPPVPASSSTREAQQDTSWRSELLQRFDAIHLSEMKRVALLRRTDTKYLMSEAQLVQALAHLSSQYRILEVAGQRLQRYETLYFDTQNLALYRQHHDGRRSRYKVRERAYLDSNLTFWEIKHKVNDNTTIKSRKQTRELNPQIARDARPFLHAHYPYPLAALEPTLYNTFQRITLVSKQSVERLTIDIGLRLLRDDACVSLDGLVIAEVKQDGFSMDSAFVQEMRALGVRPTGFSKYCIGVSLLYPEVKHNRFKPQLRRVEQLVHQGRIM
jgi:hypothetical protein